MLSAGVEEEGEAESGANARLFTTTTNAYSPTPVETQRSAIVAALPPDSWPVLTIFVDQRHGTRRHDNQVPPPPLQPANDEDEPDANQDTPDEVNTKVPAGPRGHRHVGQGRDELALGDLVVSQLLTAANAKRAVD